VAKRVFDVIITLFIAPVAALLAVIMALALAIDLRGNPFFVQERIGLNGKPFRMYKLRTMRHPQPGEHKRYVVHDWSSFVFSPSDEADPRITRCGAFARKLSLDEIPNLVNVLRGEMSLVGPRPELPEIVEQYPESYHRRHSVLPGIAGLAQVNGRSDLPYDEILQYDLAYVDHHSLLTDIQILVKTALVVATGNGAR
jgi:lipopolysaccharide/colanic/teichoic acid biosynthesis glycosyltransferase